MLVATAHRRGRVHICGNGGSAATVVHLASDLLAVPGNRPTTPSPSWLNLSAITVFANDVSYEECFALQLERRIRPVDTLVTISCSGNSVNIVRALEVAQAAGATCVGLLGNGGGKAGDLCDLQLSVPVSDPFVVEGVHDVVVHAIVAALRAG